MKQEENNISDDQIGSLCRMIRYTREQEDTKRKYIPIKQVLSLIGIAGTAGLVLLSPGGSALGKFVIEQLREKGQKERKIYNLYSLRLAIRRLHAQKLVEVMDDGKTQTVMLTQHGRRRIMRYALDDLTIPAPKHWDGKWRVIIYDVDEHKKTLRDDFRRTLISLGFYKLQESTWMYPYPCEEQVTFLREYFGVGNEVLYMVVDKLQDDAPYREYFGLS